MSTAEFCYRPMEIPDPDISPKRVLHLALAFLRRGREKLAIVNLLKDCGNLREDDEITCAVEEKKDGTRLILTHSIKDDAGRNQWEKGVIRVKDQTEGSILYAVFDGSRRSAEMNTLRAAREIARLLREL